jgi:hypothetical protein
MEGSYGSLNVLNEATPVSKLPILAIILLP